MPSLFFNSLIKIIDLLLQLNLFAFGSFIEITESDKNKNPLYFRSSTKGFNF